MYLGDNFLRRRHHRPGRGASAASRPRRPDPADQGRRTPALRGRRTRTPDGEVIGPGGEAGTPAQRPGARRASTSSPRPSTRPSGAIDAVRARRAGDHRRHPVADRQRRARSSSTSSTATGRTPGRSRTCWSATGIVLERVEPDIEGTVDDGLSEIIGPGRRRGGRGGRRTRDPSGRSSSAPDTMIATPTSARSPRSARDCRGRATAEIEYSIVLRRRLGRRGARASRHSLIGRDVEVSRAAAHARTRTGSWSATTADRRCAHERSWSPAAPASSAPTTSGPCCSAPTRTRGRPVTVLDKLTYAGNPANLDPVDGTPATRSCRATSATRDSLAELAARPRRGRALRGRDPRRPLHRGRAATS